MNKPFKIQGINKLKPLNIPDNTITLLINKAYSYNEDRYINIRICDLKENILVILIKQTKISENHLSKTALRMVAKHLFEDILPKGYHLKIIAIPFQEKAINDLTVEDLKAMIAKTYLKNCEFAEKLGIEDRSLSRILSGVRKPTNWHKSSIFYLCQSLI